MQQILSIIIPAYNEERYISECLKAIAGQTLMPGEVIVVDNNSSDRTAAIAAAYPFVRVVKAERQGIVFARDAGFNAAKGDIICRIDADTVLDSEWVARTNQYFLEHADTDAVTGKCYFYDVPFKRMASASQAFGYHVLQPLIAGTQVLWGSNMAIRRKSWLSVREHHDVSGLLDEDVMLSLRMADAGMRIDRELSLLAGVSLRRGNTSPGELWRYLRSWPLNYAAAGRPWQSLCIWGLMPAAWFGAAMAGVMRQLFPRRAPHPALRALYAAFWR